jgi:pimeloyl-ACP methyl ester carboxylesterase
MRKFTLLLFIFSTVLAAAQEANDQFFTSFDGTKLYYEVKGEGYPVVLIHGFISTSESWTRSPLHSDLINNGFKVIILDQRGNGKSDKPHDLKAYENDAEAKDIIGLMNYLSIKKYAAVGYSRGSIIASRLLVLDKNAEAVVLGGMGSAFTNPNWPRREMFYRALSGEPVEELAAMVKYVKESGRDQRALAYLQKAQPSTSPQELNQEKKPVLVICGDQDEDNGSSKELSEMIPGSVYKRVPGKHNDTVQSREFSEEVVLFLRGLK